MASRNSVLAEAATSTASRGLSQGSVSQRFLIVSRWVQGKRRQVKVLEAGGFFGEMALINHAPRAADCIAVGKVKVALTHTLSLNS